MPPTRFRPMLWFCTPGSWPDRLAMAVFTFLAVGVAVVGARTFGEPFCWSLLSGVVPLLYWNPHRARGFAAWAALLLTILAAFAAGPVPLGLAAGLVAGGLFRSGYYYAAFHPVPTGQPNAWPLSVGQQLMLFGACVLGWVELGDAGWLPWLAVALFVGLFAWCPRATFELLVESVLRVMYSIRWGGPGDRLLPPRGGVLVIANHGCWFDPMFMGKILRRPMKPMMTSKFFGIWYIRPLLKYIFRVIVVPDVERRKDAPELRDAVTALKAGECVLIFPEGYLRRSDDKPMRRFGQGAWQILKECPDVPVVACWIEGGWGSFCSYKDGPPTKNKPKDWGRPIRIGLAEPTVIPAEVLADQMRTRFHLMNMVSAARVHAGLEPLPPFVLPTGAGGNGDAD